MTPLKNWVLPLAALLIGVLLVDPVSAQKKKTPARHVQDDAGMFSKAAEEKANAIIADIKKAHNKDLFIETFASPPERYEKFRKGDKWDISFGDDWAADEFKQLQVDGVYVLICRSPGILEVRAGEVTTSKYFKLTNVRELKDLMIAHLKTSTKQGLTDEQRQQERDKALLDGAKYVQRVMNENHPVGGAAGGGAKTGGGAAEGNWQDSILGWICIGLVVLVVIWIVVAIIRAISNMGRPAYGPGQGGGYGGGGPGYGYGGGGGGGFFPSLLGGLFGAAAGMWMYNSFFGGHSSAYAAPPQAPMGGDPGAGTDVGGGSVGAGGTWGGDDAGGGGAGAGGAWGGDADAGGRGDKGDFGGGDRGDKGDFGGDRGDKGGDWGGGDQGGAADAGGDWGGGGGDAGGGGDWGGGGGGDFGGDAGGGGGDW